MAKRIASLITFKEGVTKEEAARALKHISRVLDLPATEQVPVYEAVPPGRANLRPGRRVVRYETHPFRIESLVNEYDEEMGRPAFYIP